MGDNQYSSDSGTEATDPGKLFIISAPSGTGKTTLCNAMRKQFPDLVYSISYTTRAPRAKETEAVDYHFITKEQFEKHIRDGNWAEWAEVHGNFYGTSAEDLNAQLEAGRDILLDIDVNGAKQIKQRFANSITIFIMPPSIEELRNRLKSRNSEPEDVIKRRIENAKGEIASKNFYDHIIINDRLEDAIEQLSSLIEQYRNRTENTAASDV